MLPFSSHQTGNDALENNLNFLSADAKKIEYHQLLEAGSKIPLIIIVNIIMGVLAFMLMWNDVPDKLLTSWIVLLMISIMIRSIISMTYKKVQLGACPRIPQNIGNNYPNSFLV